MVLRLYLASCCFGALASILANGLVRGSKEHLAASEYIADQIGLLRGVVAVQPYVQNSTKHEVKKKQTLLKSKANRKENKLYQHLNRIVRAVGTRESLDAIIDLLFGPVRQHVVRNHGIDKCRMILLCNFFSTAVQQLSTIRCKLFETHSECVLLVH